MDKKLKYLLRAVAVIIVGYIICFIGDYMIHGHSTDWKKWKEYTYLFNESIIQDVDTFLASSYIAKNDIQTTFHYIPNDSGRTIEEKFLYNPKDTAYRVLFWEFKKLSHLKIDDIDIRTNQNLDNLKLKRGEILDSKSDQRISIHFGFEYESMTVNVDNHSKIEKKIEGRNYKGFIGSINRISLSNENNEHEIFIDYVPIQKQVLFLIYNSNERFYIIIIDSEKKFDESIMSILNLK
jgi:hypothetical protein